MRRLLLAAAMICCGALTAHAQSGMYQTMGALKWGPAPPAFPSGAQMAVLSGDPTKNGEYTVRLRMPANYRIMPHYHPAAENVTVITGSLSAGMGDHFDKKKGMKFSRGGYASLGANVHHYAWTTEPAVIQVHGMGPFQLTYVNPADMRKR
jgi:hypothetical protein